jgi:hypothetical protein
MTTEAAEMKTAALIPARVRRRYCPSRGAADLR